MRTRLLAASAAVLLLGGPLAAADFWLAAESWEPSPDGRVIITAGTGERFPSRAEFVWPDGWLADWRLIGARGEVAVNRTFERADRAMAVPVMLPEPGAYLGIAVVSPQYITRTGPEFTAYLQEEGLDAISAARASAGETAAEVTHRHGHYAKIAVRRGAGLGLHLIRPVGLRAELVPAIDPTELAPGAPITVQLLVDGAPVGGATVTAVSADTEQKAVTDSQGLVTFSMDHPGAWLIRTVHMVRLSPSSDGQWESFGVTLAFHTAIH